MITADLLKSIAPQAHDPEAWALSMHEAASKYGILDTPIRTAMWLAQLAHESRGFSAFEENLNYSWMRLREIFPKYYRTDDEAKAHAHNKQKIGNRVYANRFGNGDEASGDGYKYRGRGLIHLTFKANYIEAGEATGFDLLNFPQKAAEPECASMVAGWYWQSRHCNEAADLDSLEASTRAINGGLNGWADRLHWYQRTKRILKL